MKSYRSLKGVCLTPPLVLLLITMTNARIPEPDNIIFGELPLGVNHVMLEVNAQVVASYTRGENPRAGDHFILRVPIDAIDPREPGSARSGDDASVFLNQDLAPVLMVVIGEKGLVQELDLDPLVDSDHDGVMNSVDNCIGVANADQADGDGDGVGDVCDNCVAVANADQADSTDPKNGIGDACDGGDSDGDGLPDAYEYRLGFVIGNDDRNGDADNDGTTNYDEYVAQTNPVPMCGDVSDDTWVELDDLVQTLQVVSGVAVNPSLTSDCNEDSQIGLVEALAILRTLGGN